MKSWMFMLLILAAMPRIASAEEPALISPAASPATQPATQPAAGNASIDQIRHWFDELASTEAAVREKARTELLGMSRDQLPVLRQVVRTSRPIAPAQSAVLHDIVVHVFLAGENYDGQDKGFMGVMLALDTRDLLPDPVVPREDDAGVLVQECMPGFCGFRFLRAGDLIMGLRIGEDSMRTTRQGELIETVQKLKPGSALTLNLVREGRLMDVTLILSDRPALSDPNAFAGGSVQQWRNERMSVSEQYWKEVFEPLLEGGVS